MCSFDFRCFQNLQQSVSGSIFGIASVYSFPICSPWVPGLVGRWGLDLITGGLGLALITGFGGSEGGVPFAGLENGLFRKEIVV